MNYPRIIMLYFLMVLIFTSCSKEYNYTVPDSKTSPAAGRGISSVLTIAELRNTKITGDVIYLTLDNGLSGKWAFDPADTQSADNTGTILINLEGKRLKRILSATDPILVAWFGLKGDGSNETNTLQAAINASAGRTLILIPGTFLSAKLNLVSNLVLIGNNAKLQNIQAASTDNIFITIWNLSNVEISGLEIALNGIKGDIWSGTAAVQVQGSNNIHIHHCHIHDNTYVAIRLTGGNTHIRVNNNFIENTDTGIHANNTNTDVTITGNIISKGTSEGITIYGYNESNIPSNFMVDSNVITHKDFSFGINIAYAKLGTLQNNMISDCLGGITLHDVVSVGNEKYYTTDMTIRNNKITNTGFGIIYIGDRTVIDNNTLENIQQDAINVNNYPDQNILTKNVTISNNHITGPALNGGGRGGISINNLQNSLISNNQVNKCSQAFAIRFSGNCDNLLIEKNNLGDGQLESNNTVYNKQIMIRENLIAKTYFPPSSDPFSNQFRMVVTGNTYTTDTTYNTAPNSNGIYSDLNVYNVRTCYSIAAGTIKSIIPSWSGRIIQLKSANNFLIQQGNNIRLKNSIDINIPQDRIVTLQFDGNTWNEIARTF